MGRCPVKSARILVVSVTGDCSGSCTSTNFQWLISFWPSDGSNSASDKDKQGPLPGAKAKSF